MNTGKIRDANRLGYARPADSDELAERLKKCRTGKHWAFYEGKRFDDRLSGKHDRVLDRAAKADTPKQTASKPSKAKATPGHTETVYSYKGGYKKVFVAYSRKGDVRLLVPPSLPMSR